MNVSDSIDWGLVAELREPQNVTPPATRRKNRRHYQRNREYYIQKAKKWREQNPEQSRQYMHAYYLKQKQSPDVTAKRRESARKWHQKFKEQHGISYTTFRKRRLAASRTNAADNTPPNPPEKDTHGGRESGPTRTPKSI